MIIILISKSGSFLFDIAGGRFGLFFFLCSYLFPYIAIIFTIPHLILLKKCENNNKYNNNE